MDDCYEWGNMIICNVMILYAKLYHLAANGQPLSIEFLSEYKLIRQTNTHEHWEIRKPWFFKIWKFSDFRIFWEIFKISTKYFLDTRWTRRASKFPFWGLLSAISTQLSRFWALFVIISSLCWLGKSTTTVVHLWEHLGAPKLKKIKIDMVTHYMHTK